MTNLVQFPGLGLSFELDRVAFSIGGMNIYWYGVCIAVGMCLALVFAFRHSVEFGVDADAMVDVILIGVVMGILCARLYYVALSPYQYHSLKDVLAIRDGGLAIYGGIIGAFLFGGLACKWRKVPVLPMFDLAAMGFLIGQGCGRWGNFFNQEAFGCNTTLPWGMFSETTRAYLMGSTVTAQSGVTIDPNLPVHPTFLYESIWCFVGFLLLFRYIKKRKFNGDIALRYMIWYGAGRFWIEALRTDTLRGFSENFHYLCKINSHWRWQERYYTFVRRFSPTFRSPSSPRCAGSWCRRCRSGETRSGRSCRVTVASTNGGTSFTR